MTTYPHVRVKGDPRERGRQYGEQAAGRIGRSIEAYRDVFQALAGWDWKKVREEAAAFEAPVRHYNARCAEEMAGIAEGARVPLEDVLAINVRTEVMFAALARAAERDRGGAPECTSVVALPSATAGHTLLAQNWDWLPHCFETVVVLEAEQDEGPDYVTIVEAGILAKVGMNSSGIAVGTNSLVSADDVGAPGVPFHVIVRALLDAETMSDALRFIAHASRSSSANYLIAHEEGTALSVETAPGDYSRVFPVMPKDGVVCHTNHFISPTFAGKDVSLWAMPDSPFRLERLCESLRTRESDVSPELLQGIFRDHADYPMGICFHPDPRERPADQGATVFSAIWDLPGRRLYLADGAPCCTPYRVLDYRTFLAKASPLDAKSRQDGVSLHEAIT